MSCIVTSKIKVRMPSLPFENIANAVLGKSYSLSLIFVGKRRACTLNKTYRKATYTPNVLSFPLSQNVGEIYITPEIAKKEASQYELSYRGYIGYLFIHGLLHLKGYPHGATMEKAEKKYMAQFNLT